MLEIKNKPLSYIVNFLLFIWQLTQVIPGAIGLAIFRNYEVYRNEEANIKVIKICKGNLFGNACFSCGPFIFVTPNCDDNTIRHETGHSVQSLWFGFLFHFIVSFPSICRFWYRRWKKLPSSWYYQAWPENSAEKRGHTHR